VFHVILRDFNIAFRITFLNIGALLNLCLSVYLQQNKQIRLLNEMEAKFQRLLGSNYPVMTIGILYDQAGSGKSNTAASELKYAHFYL